MWCRCTTSVVISSPSILATWSALRCSVRCQIYGPIDSVQNSFLLSLTGQEMTSWYPQRDTRWRRWGNGPKAAGTHFLSTKATRRPRVRTI
jgi:hypothetical protein